MLFNLKYGLFQNDLLLKSMHLSIAGEVRYYFMDFMKYMFHIMATIMCNIDE